MLGVAAAAEGMFPERPYRDALGPGQNGSQSLQRRPYFAPKRVFKRSFAVFRRETRFGRRLARGRGRAVVATLSQQYSGPATRKNPWIPWGNSGRAPKTRVFTPGIAVRRPLGPPLFPLWHFVTPQGSQGARRRSVGPSVGRSVGHVTRLQNRHTLPV